MLNVSLDLSEVRNFAKNLPAMKENIFEIMNLDTKRIAKDFLETMMSAEISLFLGREKYQRQPLVSVTSRNYRNGWYNRSFCIKGIGQIEMKVPRDRRGEFQTSIIPKYERIDDRIKQDCLLLYLTGLSTRTLEMLSTRLFGRKISKSEISELSKELAPKIEQWRNIEKALGDNAHKAKGPFWALRDAKDMAEAKVLSDQLESILRNLNKSALESYLEAKDDLLAMHDLKLSRDLKKFFSTTNPIESLNSLLEEDMRRVKHWKNSEHFQRWLATFCLHNEKRMRKVRGYRGLPALWVLVREITKQEIEIDFEQKVG